jgi:hypothetical protein
MFMIHAMDIQFLKFPHHITMIPVTALFVPTDVAVKVTTG